jgi:hypothetical protein
VKVISKSEDITGFKIPITPSTSVRADYEKMLRKFNNRFSEIGVNYFSVCFKPDDE